jgi:hypothetical protein
VRNYSKQDLQRRAEASFKKEERAREGAQAMLEYQVEGRAVRDKTARLKALRLARDAQVQIEEPAPKTTKRRCISAPVIGANDEH